MLEQKQQRQEIQAVQAWAPAARRQIPQALAGCFAKLGTKIKIKKNMEIYGEGEPAEYVYKIVSGAVRTCKILADGRRQIGSFFLPGDFFGMEAGIEHSFTAEAVTDISLIFMKRRALTDLAAHDIKIATELWSAATTELRAAQNHIILLGRRSALERLAAFLIEIAERTDSRETIHLPMSRLDIADYLGLTIETVSRSITLLENTAAISLHSTRSIQFRDRAALSRLSA